MWTDPVSEDLWHFLIDFVNLCCVESVFLTEEYSWGSTAWYRKYSRRTHRMLVYQVAWERQLQCFQMLKNKEITYRMNCIFHCISVSFGLTKWRNTREDVNMNKSMCLKTPSLPFFLICCTLLKPGFPNQNVSFNKSCSWTEQNYSTL